MSPEISRRDVLKLGGAALAGLALSSRLSLESAGAAGRFPVTGRVAATKLKVRERPSYSAGVLSYQFRDALVQLKRTLPADDDPRQVWYELAAPSPLAGAFGGDADAKGGYVTAAYIQQPVENRPNQPVESIPEGGIPGEITVPFSDAYWQLGDHPYPGGRLYYSSVHWIVSIGDEGGERGLWYRAYDQQTKAHYFIRAEAVRIVPPEEFAPLSAQVPPEEKRIEVWLEEQRLVAFEGSTAVFTARTSTGAGFHGTPTGQFHTFHKRPGAHMSSGYIDLPGVPWSSYITENGVAFHGAYWHSEFGVPHSHGCINLTPADALWIYRWTTPVMLPGVNYIYLPGQGTRVSVLASAEDSPMRRSYIY
jgi:L,D-transpeptidase-like protein